MSHVYMFPNAANRIELHATYQQYDRQYFVRAKVWNLINEMTKNSCKEVQVFYSMNLPNIKS